MSFLNPDAATKLAIKAKQDERAQQKKAAAKTSAEERKRQRTKEAERVGVIKQSLGKKEPDTKTADRAGLRIEEYLNKPPYFGNSEKCDKNRIKELCVRSRWDAERRLWGTFNIDSIPNLIHSQKWTPFGIETSWIPRLLAEVERRVVLKKEQQRAEEEEQQRAAKEPPVEEPVVPMVKVETVAEKVASSKARELNSSMVPATADEMAECAALGLTADTIEASIGFVDLGPRLGMSSEGRLLRWIEFARMNVRYDYDLGPEIYAQPARLQHFQERAVTELVTSLNTRAHH